MIVVDTNVIGYLWLPGVHTEAAKKLMIKDPAWYAPLLWRSEFRNVLAGYLRRNLLDLQTAVEILQQAEHQMHGHERAVPSIEVMRLVNETSCSAYDCEFVVVAKELGAPLYSLDKELLSAFPKIARALD